MRPHSTPVNGERFWRNVTIICTSAVAGISAESAIIKQDVKPRQDRTSLRAPVVECELLSIGLKVP